MLGSSSEEWLLYFAEENYQCHALTLSKCLIFLLKGMKTRAENSEDVW